MPNNIADVFLNPLSVIINTGIMALSFIILGAVLASLLVKKIPFKTTAIYSKESVVTGMQKQLSNPELLRKKELTHNK